MDRNEAPARPRDAWLSRAASALVVVLAAFAGADLFGTRVRIDARSDWEALSPDLREAGRPGALAGPAHLSLSIPGLSDRDSVELVLLSRPGVSPLGATAVRGEADPVRAVAGENAPTILSLAPTRGTVLTLDVEAAPGSTRRPVYLFHLLEIGVIRAGLWPTVRPAVPALVAVVVWWFFRRGSPWSATLGSLLGATLVIALMPDPVATIASHGRWAWLTGFVVLGGALKIATESLWGVISRVTLGLGLVLLVAVMTHAPRVNGPSYWEWPFQRLDWVATFGAVAAASLPLFAARALHARGGARPGFLLALISSGTALTATAAMGVQPTGLDRMHSLIESPVVTSYYTDALELGSEPEWMATYPERLPSLHLHTKTKPPGSVMFYVGLIRVFGEGSVAAAIGGLLLAIGAALSVPAVFLLARELGESNAAAFEAACVMAVSPSLLLFFPEFDQIFPAMVCVLLIAWRRAVNGSARAAVVVGLTAVLATFFSYSLMTLGIAGLLLAVGHLRGALKAAVQSAAVATLTYASLHAVSGFDPIATFRSALANQARFASELDRPYLKGLLSDPWDFAMGAGWLASFIALVAVVRAWRAGERTGPAMLVVAQIGAVYFSGLLSVEAARLWLFLVPFVAIPAGRELALWTAEERSATFVVMGLLFAAVTQNMTFLF